MNIFNKLSIAFVIPSVILGSVGLGHHSSKNPVSHPRHFIVQSWHAFKRDAETVKPNDLKNLVSHNDLINNFGWNINDKAAFATVPMANNENHTLTTTLMISGSLSATHPINFKIKYNPFEPKVNDTYYNLHKWNYTMPINNNSIWSHFKTTALEVTPMQLLNQAQSDNNWFNWNWYGSSWVQSNGSSLTPEFDIYGGNGKNDSFSGMVGKPKANDLNHTIRAIISIKGREGLENACPIEATIPSWKNIYNLNLWTFKPITQSQSYQQYTKEFNKVLTQAQQINTNTKFDNFAKNNWTDERHSKNIKSDFNNQLSKHNFPEWQFAGCQYHTFFVNKIKNGYQFSIVFNLYLGKLDRHTTGQYTIYTDYIISPDNANATNKAFHKVWPSSSMTVVPF